MKKLFLTLGLAMATMTSFAYERVLYQENFESATDVAATGWTYGGGSLTIASDDFGKFIELALGQNNGRSGQVKWGQEIFFDAEGNSLLPDGQYTMIFDFCIAANGTNQYNGEITVFTNHDARANETFRFPWTAGYTGPWNNYIFDMSQVNTSVETDWLAAINAPNKATVTTNDEGVESTSYSIDTAETYTVSTGQWYTVTLNVDTESRVVEYDVTDLSSNNLVSGEMTVPEENVLEDHGAISMYAEGIFVMTPRYQSKIDIDNVKIFFETDEAVANKPTVVLKALGKEEVNGKEVANLNYRLYNIQFAAGETLHVIGTDGATAEVEWADCDGEYAYGTTTSGTLTAWTTCDDATSEQVVTEVNCEPVVLPAATVTISSVSEGFGKTYVFNVSNESVELRPTIFISYEFTGKSGAKLTAEGLASGEKVTVTEEGSMTITTSAFGYQATTTTINNDLEFAVKKTYDFARMTQEDLTAAGFTEWTELNTGTTSGFSNWTGRGRLFYYDSATETTDAEGNTTYTAVKPFGYVSEDGPALHYSEIGTDGGDLGINVTGYELFEGIRVYAGHNVTALLHVGMINNSTSGGNNKNIDVLNLDQTDFVVINRINDYGSNSCHPIVATTEEYYAQLAGDDEVFSVAAKGVLDEATGKYTLSMPVYRIDTAATKVTIFAQQGEGAGVDNVAVDEKENNDPYYYTIDGIRLAEPTHPGFYIHNGKKILVK